MDRHTKRGLRGLGAVALLAVLATVLSACPVQVRESTEPVGGTDAAPSATLTVFAAASLTDAFTEIAEQFEAARREAGEPDVRVLLNFAGSQQLAQQMAQGAPAAVFASANGAQMAVAIEAGRVVSGTPQIFARNRLVAVAPADNPAGIETLQDMARPGVTVLLAAEEVPVGRYAQEFLNKAAADAAFGEAFRDNVLANVVSYENNVRAVLTKIQLGEADVGIVYSSDILPAENDDVIRFEIPDALNTLAEYPIAPVQSINADSTSEVELAQQFIDLVLGPNGQTILETYGFIPVSEEASE